MWETLRNVWRVPELRKKVLYTFFMLLIFRLVSVIPVPGVDRAAIAQAMGTYDMLGLVNMMTGSSFSQMTIMAMGISPYINSSIIMQLLRGQAEDHPLHPVCDGGPGCASGHRHHWRPERHGRQL